MRYPSITLTLMALESLITNDQLCTEFPFMGYAKSVWNREGVPTYRAGCSKCNKRPNKEFRQHVLDTVKAHLASLPPDRIRRFKDILNTDQVVMYFIVQGNHVMKTV